MRRKETDGWLDVVSFLELGDVSSLETLAASDAPDPWEAEGLSVRSFEDLFEDL